jgi:predicted DNA-binding protein (MmcQ/YjbR family)
MVRSNLLIEQVRETCLAFPESSEVETWGHPSFRAGKKAFAAIEIIDGRPSLAVRVEPLETDVRAGDELFFVTPYGRGKWLSIWLDRDSAAALIPGLIGRAYRIVANKRMLAALHG